MNIKGQYWIIIAVALAIIAIAVGIFVLSDESGKPIIINQGITDAKSFEEIDEITGTSIQAVYYVQKDDGGRTYVLISASFDIAAEDRAGVELSFPGGVAVTDIVYTYQDSVEKGLTRMIATEPQDYMTSIEVGNVFHGSPPGGGQGSLLLKLQITENQENSFKMRLGLGSSGVIMYTTVKEIVIEY